MYISIVVRLFYVGLILFVYFKKAVLQLICGMLCINCILILSQVHCYICRFFYLAFELFFISNISLNLFVTEILSDNMIRTV